VLTPARPNLCPDPGWERTQRGVGLAFPGSRACGGRSNTSLSRTFRPIRPRRQRRRTPGDLDIAQQVHVVLRPRRREGYDDQKLVGGDDQSGSSGIGSPAALLVGDPAGERPAGGGAGEDDLVSSRAYVDGSERNHSLSQL